MNKLKNHHSKKKQKTLILFKFLKKYVKPPTDTELLSYLKKEPITSKLLLRKRTKLLFTEENSFFIFIFQTKV